MWHLQDGNPHQWHKRICKRESSKVDAILKINAKRWIHETRHPIHMECQQAQTPRRKWDGPLQSNIIISCLNMCTKHSKMTHGSPACNSSIKGMCKVLNPWRNELNKTCIIINHMPSCLGAQETHQEVERL